MKVRFRATNKIYQVILQHNGKKLRVKDLEIIAENDDEFVLYDWGAETYIGKDATRNGLC